MTFQERYKYNPNTDLLGKGGFARVYKATDTVLDREVALKIFSTDTSQKYDLVSEIKKVIKLEHPNLCRYYDVAFVEFINAFGEEEKHQIGVLEYLDGGDLKSYCLKHPGQQIKLLTDVLHGLSFLHKRGIIHRDLKPANILIKNSEDGPLAKITDFGISKEVGSNHTSSSLLMGTIEYMAPEQFSPAKYGIDGKIGTNLDLWSFGLMVYELVTGKSLFGSRGSESSAEQVMSNILNNEVIEDKITNLPEPYLSVVKRCLIKDAKQRVQSGEELVAWLHGKAVTAPSLAVPAETQILPKPGLGNPMETQVIPAEKVTATLQVAAQASQKNGNKIVFSLLAVFIFILAGMWSWKFSNTRESTVRLYPVYDAATHKYGMADSLGKLVVPKKYDFIDSMYEGMAVCFQNNRAGWLNDHGEEMDMGKYDNVGRFGYGVAVVNKKTTNFYLVDANGKTIKSAKYIERFDRDGVLFLTPESGSTKLYDILTGKDLFSGIARVQRLFSKTSNWAVVQNFSNHLLFINRSGKQLPGEYDGTDALDPGQYPFKNELSAVIPPDHSKGWYNIDTSGNKIGPVQMKSAPIYSESLFMMEKNGKVGFVNKNEEVIVPFQFENGGIARFSEGLAGVFKNDKYGFIDKNGNTVIPFNYASGGDFHNGVNAVAKSINQDRYNTRYGLIDKSGKKITGFLYDELYWWADGCYIATIGTKQVVINSEGKEIMRLIHADNIWPYDFLPSIFLIYDRKAGRNYLFDMNGNKIRDVKTE